jgi:biotin carboxyl carrier protein
MKKYRIKINESFYEVEIKSMQKGKIPVIVNGIDYEVEIEKPESPFATGEVRAKNAELATGLKPILSEGISKREAPASGKGDVLAPMPAKVIEVNVEAGDKVKSGDVLLKLEAMKMENEVRAPIDGIVKEVRVSPGVQVQTKDILVVLGL